MDDRQILSGVTTEVSAAWGHVRLDHKVQDETVVTVLMPWDDARKLFHDLSMVLHRH